MLPEPGAPSGFRLTLSAQQLTEEICRVVVFGLSPIVSNAFAFDVLDRDGFEAGAKYLLKRGYQ